MVFIYLYVIERMGLLNNFGFEVVLGMCLSVRMCVSVLGVIAGRYEICSDIFCVNMLNRKFCITCNSKINNS